MRILINAGHGGKDCGAVGKNGLKEAYINNKIASLICDYLDNVNTVVLFQQKKSLNEVIKLCNIGNFDFAVSIHCNASSNRQANGIETLYYPTSTKGKELANCIQQELVKTKTEALGFKLEAKGWENQVTLWQERYKNQKSFVQFFEDKAMQINQSILPIIRLADSLTFPVGYKLLAKAKGLNTCEGNTPEQAQVLEAITNLLKRSFQ